jgi:transposase-like protein
MVVNGVSTRKVARITDELCGREFKRSTVSELAKGLDGQVEAWNERPLEGRYPFVLVDAMHIKVRRQQSVHSTSVLIAVGVNEEGYREILGSRIVDSDSEQSWLETLRWLKARGLGGVELVVSDAHQGLVSALERSFQGAVWQRCQVYFRKNLTDRAPKSVQDALHRGLDRIFDAERTTSPPGSPSPPSATSWPAGRIGRWLRMDTFQNWKRNRDTPALGQVA